MLKMAFKSPTSGILGGFNEIPIYKWGVVWEARDRARDHLFLYGGYDEDPSQSVSFFLGLVEVEVSAKKSPKGGDWLNSLITFDQNFVS